MGCVYGIAASFGIRTVPSFMKNTENISKVAAKNYCLRPWPGPVTLFRASIQADTRLPRDLGWTRLAEGGVEVYEVPGDHNLPFEEPGVRRLAERLRARLEDPMRLWRNSTNLSTLRSHRRIGLPDSPIAAAIKNCSRKCLWI